MFWNSLPIIEIYNTGHAFQNKTKLTGWYARVSWQCFAKNRQNNGRNTGGQNWPTNFFGGVNKTMSNSALIYPYVKNNIDDWNLRSGNIYFLWTSHGIFTLFTRYFFTKAPIEPCH